MKNLNSLTQILSGSRSPLFFGIILINSLLFQSCNYSTAYKCIQQEKVFKDKKYENDKLFKMREGNIQAPLMSQKGQINLNADLIHGFGASMSSAISDNIYVQAGANFLKSNELTHQTSMIQIEDPRSATEKVTDTLKHQTRVDYDLNLKLHNYSFYGSIGKYKTFGNHGRFEYCGGFAYGNARNKYTYDFYEVSNYSFEESRKYFQYYAQTDFGYVTKKSEGALIVRASCFKFFDQKFNMDYPLNGYTMENNQVVLQPAIKFGFGGNFRVSMQCGWNIPLADSQLKWFSTNVQAGIVYKINNKSRSK